MGVPRFLTGTLAGTLAGALAALMVLLAACGGDDESIADPPVSPHPTSSSPTGTPQRESPEAFIRRWAAEDIRMQETGDTSRFRALSIGCHDCEKLADRVDGIYNAGGYIRTAGWSIKRIEVASRSGGHLLANLRVASRPTTYRESAHSPRKSYPGGPATYQLGVAK